MVGAGRAELTGKAHGVEREREKGSAGQRLGVWQNGPARQRGKRGAQGESNWRRQVGPTGQREGGGKRAGQKPPLTGGANLSGGAGARTGWAELGRLGCFAFFFSLDFLIAFPFLFSRVFNPNSIQVSNSN
jgi:hypothetical protein